MKPVILLTGVTGFVGKVVLSEILRQLPEPNSPQIYLLIRGNDRESNVFKRYLSEVVSSPCFSKIQNNLTQGIRVVRGELSLEKCGLSGPDWDVLTKEVTHIINCAASVEFDLPLPEAARCNITSSLNVLELARLTKNLKSLVHVSTAYVTPHKADDHPVKEKLVPLPFKASEVYQQILEGKADTKALLKITGLPNTYTLTKCLSEHLLTERRGEIPLTLIRPSIVSAAWKYPFPGWIDSQAAFAGFVALIGTGYLRAVVARYATHLDVVPCDVVADRILKAAFPSLPGGGEVIIRHVVSGPSNSCQIDQCIDIIEDYFRRYPVARFPKIHHVRGNDLFLRLMSLLYHDLPLGLAALGKGLAGNQRQKRRIKRLKDQLSHLNTGFHYFTHKTFHFQSTVPLDDPSFKKEDYIEGICRGVYQNLLKQDERLVSLGGAVSRKSLRRIMGLKKTNGAMKTLAYVTTKLTQQCSQGVTFDRASFERVVRQIPPGTLPVIVPTHRSYADFLLCSYLFLMHPELGIEVPHIAAAREFSRIPFLGWMFGQARAFYIPRAQGKEDPVVTQRINALVKQNRVLEFFIEGTRSRSREMLPPKRGLMRCLQKTGRRFAFIPISLSYDHVPEEKAFLKELQGQSKPEMKLSVVLRWVIKVLMGQIDIGRVHMACGDAVFMDQTTDINEAAQKIIAELQLRLVATTHHLTAFLYHHPQCPLKLEEIENRIDQRGGLVIESPLAGRRLVDPAIERTMRHQWAHWFEPEELGLEEARVRKYG